VCSAADARHEGSLPSGSRPLGAARRYRRASEGEAVRHPAVRQPHDWEVEEVEAAQVRPRRQAPPVQLFASDRSNRAASARPHPPPEQPNRGSVSFVGARKDASSRAGVSRRSACRSGPCRCSGRGLPYALRVALVSRSTDKVPSRALSIPWCAFHRPERPFRFAFLVDLGLARVRRATTRRGFRLAGFDSAGAVAFASGAVGGGVVSSGQNFLVLSVTRIFSMVCRPLPSSSPMAVSVTSGGISRSVSKKFRRASSPSTRCRPGPRGTNTSR